MLHARSLRNQLEPFPPRALYAALWLFIAAFGCGGCGAASGAFATRYPDNVESSLQGMIARAQAGARRVVPSVAAGVTPDGKLYGYDLAAKRVLWEVPGRPRFAPLLAGDTVVIQEGERVVGLDIKSGSPRFQFDAADMHLVGADGVGVNAVITLT